MTYKNIFKITSIAGILSAGLMLTTSSLAQAKTNITVWSWAEQQTFIKQFEKRHPDIHVKAVQFPYAVYQRKIMTIMRSPKHAPDIFSAHISYIQKFIKYKLYKPLPEFNKYKADFMPYVWDLSSDDKGTLYAPAFESSPGAFVYNRDFAKKTFGTDDPKKVSKYFDTWDHMFTSIDKINKTMGKKMKFLDSIVTILGMSQAKYKQPLVLKGNVLNTGPMIRETFKIFKDLSSRNSILEEGVDNYVSKVIMNNGLFGLMAPAWGIKKIAHIAPNTVGHWGLVSGPQSYSRGGSFYGINSGLTDPARLKASKLYIKEMTLQTDTATEFVKAKNDFPGNYKVLNNMSDATSDVLKGQKYIPVMAAKSKDIYVNPTEFDDVLSSILESTNTYIRNHPHITIDELIAKYKKDAKQHLPKLNIK